MYYSNFNNDIPIPIVDSFRYLGVILDNKLTFSDHISNVAKKVSRWVGIISKLRQYAPTSILIKLYYAILHPHLLYGNIVWESNYKSYLQKLVSLQNKGLRLITNNFTFHQPFVSVSLLYKQNKIQYLNYQISILMKSQYSCINFVIRNFQLLFRSTSVKRIQYTN